MSELIIPAAEIIGTPLTSEELKGILAGYQTKGLRCLCSYGETSTSSIKDSLDDCAGWCSSECHKNFETNWTATYGGITVKGS